MEYRSRVVGSKAAADRFSETALDDSIKTIEVEPSQSRNAAKREHQATWMG